MKNAKEYADLLKSKGFSTSEIIFALSIKNEGITMTKAIYKFNELYDNGKIDGFPDSSIEVLEKFYGKKLKIMKEKTLIEKVARLQGCLDSNIDYDIITESVRLYQS